MEVDVLQALKRSAADLQDILEDVVAGSATREADLAVLRRLDVVATTLVMAVRRHAEHLAQTANRGVDH